MNEFEKFQLLLNSDGIYAFDALDVLNHFTKLINGDINSFMSCKPEVLTEIFSSLIELSGWSVEDLCNFVLNNLDNSVDREQVVEKLIQIMQSMELKN